jgi:hypothetical protein
MRPGRILSSSPALPRFAPAIAATLLLFSLPGVAAAQEGTITDLEITVEDIGARSTLEPIAPGGMVQIEVGQKVRLRMTAKQASGGTRYPSTRFTPNDTERISVDKIDEEVGNITLTGRRLSEGGGAVPIQYEILEDWRMRDELRTGRVYVKVIEKHEPVRPLPEPQPGSGGSRGVELYEDENYRGKRQFFSAGDRDLRNDGIGNDSVSSLKVSPGCTVTLYDDTGHRGRSVRVESDTPTMGRIGFGNDALSSFELVCRDPR